ncbi:hypothetical protein BH24CHL1_BH24CHL1_01070 [soil metagenome]
MKFERRLSRRNLLKLAGVASAATLFDMRGITLRRLTDAALQPEHWTFDAGIPREGVFQTPVLSTDGRFTSVEVSWVSNFATGEGLTLEARVSDDGATWSEWQHLHPDSHAQFDEAVRGHATPLLSPGSFVQVRAVLEPFAGLTELVVAVRDTTSDEFGARDLAQSSLIDGLIIPRAAWGADERLRYQDQNLRKPVLWPPSYAPTEKIIIHHTDTTNDFDDPAALMRAVYYYHAVTLGWGDIGYNYLIDIYGNVYEGRFGGPEAVGGHALQFNTGSIGIALLGSFMRAGPTAAAMSSLTTLIGLRASHIDVTGAGTFSYLGGVPNLCGHGDVLVTDCPGDMLYDRLPAMRGAIAGTDPVFLPRPVRTESVELVDFQVEPAVVEPDGLVTVRVTVRNPGTTVLRTQGPDPGFIYRESQNYETTGFEKIEGCYRWGVEFAGAGPTVNPYRWGFGKPLDPGEEREIVGFIRVEDLGERIATAALVKEYVGYYAQREFPRFISTVHPLTQPTPPSGDPDVTFFDVTAHNVPEPFATYWETRGGLARFGYPLTEAFPEQSVVDGVTYLTQYFERARFEHHPEYAGSEYEVLLGLLGVERTGSRVSEYPFRPVGPDQTPDGGAHFPETGHTLSGNFLDFWLENGGLPIFGYPISERFEEVSETDGELHVVQYFERNRFEYHPNMPQLPNDVLLGHLAREALLDRGWLPRTLSSVSDD